ncbi:hypothetical protein COY52_00995 [Candidatus Desantisbacteria bacterium CG_4_10_14_0_8_um_filter_48_22]|uniref:Potassium uptake system protein n=1 Tax=Candidatus Desantisbacteria bacterium CG_4_10_14_0_8_um_filter_48_22 TaxID=1974543 RepID=A0A2M7SF52_9BACT|nr:MAG: hypothetical protein AUJ67_03385 [Candidatus Desantisbacteria bacterium CG1_02_49_89]PIV56709.1 MAG: hypothetical protein COS16_03210 [Candidatus Desantisbacteria bacterium CG02_land_8_20_14_3_00_49_13]PIZ18167.1 MAG: hypothetical protein COY52_00995 [Candidatus Desantisbacteria bacterium CG_4_10_14_0_8_um_filter_48_22]PJB28898.1 MAG: hypothetical protein CO111_00350 [Candidatus Desantisbacteria bacterium CG_4_9_14_3_um_filter_50_7]
MRQFAVIGLGKFGLAVAKTLTEKGCQILVIDSDEERVREAGEFAASAIQMDATDEEALRKVGFESIDVAIVSVGENLESSILITLLLKEIGVKEVISKALTAHHAKVLQKIGADRIVFPEREMGIKVAEHLISPDILELIRLSPDYDLLEFTVPRGMNGKTLKDLALRTKYKVNIVAIKKRVPYVNDAGESEFREEINPTPNGDDELSAGDVIVMTGETKMIAEFRKEVQK